MARRSDLKTTNDFIDKAIDNIRKDRNLTQILLNDLMIYMKQATVNVRDCGLIAAKYVETLQRSNEQLVKLATLKQKQRVESAELSDDERDNLFDIIQGE
jgi:hypothetical protein